MNGLSFINAPACYMEISQDSLKVLDADKGLELPLERQADGRLSPACKERLTRALPEFLKKRPWQPRLRVFCAVGARGVSLRRLTLPAASREELHRLLLLQIESEFPLPPDQLAWGYVVLPVRQPQPQPASATQEVLVAAVKKEALEEYSEILTSCGASPAFTLAALARSYLCPPAAGAYALLDVGRQHSELITFQDGFPAAVRVLPWGGENISQALEQTLGLSHDEAEKLEARLEREPSLAGDSGQRVRAALETALESLAGVINGRLTTQKIYLTGRGAAFKEFAPQLARCLGNAVECEPVKFVPGQGRSAAILGLKTVTEKNGGWPPLVLRAKPTNGTATLARPAPWKWASAALLLALVALSLPYAEAMLLKPRLVRQLAAIKADRGRLTTIDRELDFLQFLKQNQPPFLDALFLMAKSAPPGARFDSLTMNRRGEVSIRGSMKDAQQVMDFRSKLIDSGFFANVTVEEQTPSQQQGQPKLTVRMTAQWKPAEARAVVSVAPTAKEIEEAKAGAKDMPTAMPPGMALPPAAPEPPPMPGAPGLETGPPPANAVAPARGDAVATEDGRPPAPVPPPTTRTPRKGTNE